jgi:cyclopropane fatty-acyl-phospholipid synthase-like methyltransferase
VTDWREVRTRLSNLYWEKRLGINTRGLHSSNVTDEEHIFYGTNSYRMTHSVLEHLSLREDDVVVDLGCGKGRVVCLAARYPVKEVIGIDDTALMCASARQNAMQLRGGRAPITILEMPVQQFDFRRGTVFYMFNPFGPKTTGELLKKMREGLDALPRTIRVAYSTPDHDRLLEQSGWLHRYDQWTTHTHDQIDDTISYWTNVS